LTALVTVILIAAVGAAAAAVLPRFTPHAVRLLALSLALAEVAYLLRLHPGWLS
jgi:hypothetical protein